MILVLLFTFACFGIASVNSFRADFAENFQYPYRYVEELKAVVIIPETTDDPAASHRHVILFAEYLALL